MLEFYGNQLTFFNLKFMILSRTTHITYGGHNLDIRTFSHLIFFVLIWHLDEVSLVSGPIPCPCGNFTPKLSRSKNHTWWKSLSCLYTFRLYVYLSGSRRRSTQFAFWTIFSQFNIKIKKPKTKKDCLMGGPITAN